MTDEQIEFTVGKVREACNLTAKRERTLRDLIRTEVAFTAPEALAWKLNIKIGDLVDAWTAGDGVPRG